MLNISRITLNASVQAQYGQTAVHLLKQRLLAEIKNEILFTDKTTSELAYEFNFSEPGHLMRFLKKWLKSIIRYSTLYNRVISKSG